MTELKRLTETTGSPVTRAILRSVELDEAPANTPNRVALVLGIALPATLATATTQAAAAATGSAWLGGLGAVKLTIVAAMFSSSFGIGIWAADRKIVGIEAERRLPAITRNEPQAATIPQRVAPPVSEHSALAATAAVKPTREREAPVAQTPRNTTANLGHSPASRALIQVPRASDTVPQAAFVTDEPAQPPAVLPASAATPAAGREDRIATNSELERELSLLDAASQSLRRGQARDALTLLERHRVEIARKSLTPESLVLRVQTLLALGNQAAAETVARQVIETAPNSKHAQVVRSLLKQ